MNARTNESPVEPAPPAGWDELERQLERDLPRFRSASSQVRRGRGRAGLERDLPTRRPLARHRGAWVLAGLATLAAVLAPDFLRGADTAAPAAVEAAPSAAANSPERPAARTPELADLVRVPRGELRKAVDEALLDEARRLADDGARVAAALVQRLPGPLRLAFRPRGAH